MNPTQEAIDRLIFALDVPDREEAVRYVKMLDGVVGCFKVGLELFVKEGPDVLRAIRDHSSADIFLDLKLHDIPATVKGALRSASSLGVRFITLHAGEGRAMLETAQVVQESGLQVLAVTVLTSLDEKELPALGYQAGMTISQLVANRAEAARKAGCSGVVCSGRELVSVRERCGDGFKVVVPGIRPEWSLVEGDDQSRITTPAEAISMGAAHIVVGRPIRDSQDPRSAAQKILQEIQSNPV